MGRNLTNMKTETTVDWKARAEAAEAKLVKAREALQWYADNFVVNGSRAAAVLAELEGRKG